MRKSCSVLSTLCWKLLSLIHPTVFTFPGLIKEAQEWETVITDNNCTYFYHSPLWVWNIPPVTLSRSPQLRWKCIQTSENNDMLYWVPGWLITSLNTVHPSIHPLSVTAYPIQGRGGRLEPIPADIWRRQGTPWTGHQTITGLTHRDRQSFTLTFTPTGNLESTVNLTCMSLDCGRKPENPVKNQR